MIRNYEKVLFICYGIFLIFMSLMEYGRIGIYGGVSTGMPYSIQYHKAMATIMFFGTLGIWISIFFLNKIQFWTLLISIGIVMVMAGLIQHFGVTFQISSTHSITIKYSGISHLLLLLFSVIVTVFAFKGRVNLTKMSMKKEG